MDFKGGVLNYEGLSFLRPIESEYFKTKNINNGTMLPSKGSLQCCIAKVENRRGIDIVKIIEISTGEWFEFGFEEALKPILKSHNLWEVQNRSVEISGTIDGIGLTKSCNYDTAGIKISDFSTACPMIG